MKVSFIIPVLNEEKNIVNCLESVLRQNFPKKDVEVVVIDAMSKDKTVEFAREWSKKSGIALKVVENPRIIAEFGKSEGVKAAKGDFIILLDADNEIVQTDWLSSALKSFELFPEAFGFESYYLKIPHWNAASNFLTYCLHIDDPLARDIASKPVLEQTVAADGKTFRLYRLIPGYPCGANGFIYRRSAITEFIAADTFEEGQVALQKSLDGTGRIAMIDGYGVYHYYFDSFGKFLRKRVKRAVKHETRSAERKTWVSYTGKRIYFAALYHLSFVFPFFVSVFEAIRRREILWLLYAPVAFLSTFTYLVSFVWIKLFGKKAW